MTTEHHPMPEETAAEVERFDEPTRQRSLDTWESIGEEARQRFRDYIARGWFRRSRRSRAVLAAMQLAAPSSSGFIFPPTQAPGI
jgi:hypothetical protein